MTLDKVIRNFVATFIMAAFCYSVWGQTGSGIIFGTVTDPTGAVVSGAEMTVTNVATGITEHVAADASGNYVVPDLPAATYSISCTSAGFRTLERTGILLQVDQRARVDFPLSVGQTQQVVAVQGNVTNLDTFSSAVKDVVDSARMTELPLNGRNALSLQALLPGAVPAPSGSHSIPAWSSV